MWMCSYVADSEKHCIQFFIEDGHFPEDFWGEKGNSREELNGPFSTNLA